MAPDKNGFIKLDRCLLGKHIFKNEKLLKVWVWCLLRANHSGKKVGEGLQEVELKPGQFVTGRYRAAAALDMNPSTAWKYLKWLEKNQSIAIKSNNKYSVVSIVNWELYQIEKYKGDNKMTTKEQQNDTDKNVKNVKKKDMNIFFEDMWRMYPEKKGKSKVSDKTKAEIYRHGREVITRCMERYRKEKPAWKEWQHGSTFFNGGYKDYMDGDYAPTEQSSLGEL